MKKGVIWFLCAALACLLSACEPPKPAPAPTPEPTPTPAPVAYDMFSSCGDDVCGEGENLLTCPDDCITAHGSQVIVEQGRPVLHANGQAIPLTGLTLYNPDVSCSVSSDSSEWLGFMKEQIDKAAAANLTYFNFTVTVSTLYQGNEPPTERDLMNKDNWDLTELEEIFSYAREKGVYVIVGFNPNNDVPPWWSRLNEDRFQKDNGDPETVWNIVSFNNEDFWQATDGYFEAFITLLKDQPALLGWYARGGITGENNYAPSYLVDLFAAQTAWCDYSGFAVQRFQTWLQERYVSVAELNTAWQSTYGAFSEVEIPQPLGDVSTLTEQLELENGAGDTRPGFKDWHEFRLEEKTSDFNHYFDLVKRIDPDHILLTDPAFKPVQNSAARSGTADGYLRYSYDNVDGILHHPRVSYDDEESSFNVNRNEYPQVTRYAGINGILTTWVNEDSGELNKCIDELGSVTSFEDCCDGPLDSEACYGQYATVSDWRIKSISAMMAAEGGGCGWVTGGTCLDNPTWSEDEREIFKQVNTIFTIPALASSTNRIAVLTDPFVEDLFYQKGTNPVYNRTYDKDMFFDTLFAAGLSYDAITVYDFMNGAGNNYDAIIILHIPRMAADVADKLADFRDSGGGLFIAGRTGVFNEKGAKDYSALSTLLGCSSGCITGEVEYPKPPQSLSWTFVTESAGGLVSGLTGATFSADSFVYVPVFDLAGQGFTPLAYLDDFPDTPAVGVKGKTVFWFPSINSEEHLRTVLANIWNFYGENVPAEGTQIEMLGGSYKYLMSGTTGTFDVTVELSASDVDAGDQVLLWDWIAMKELTRTTASDAGGRLTVNTQIYLTADSPVFAGFTPLDKTPRLIAVSGANIYAVETNNNNLYVGLYRIAADDVVTVVYHPGDVLTEVAVSNGTIAENSLSSDKMIGTVTLQNAAPAVTLSFEQLP